MKKDYYYRVYDLEGNLLSFHQSNFPDRLLLVFFKESKIYPEFYNCRFDNRFDSNIPLRCWEDHYEKYFEV